MSDPIVFYTRLVQDLKRLSAREQEQGRSSNHSKIMLTQEMKTALIELQKLICQTKEEYDGYIIPEVIKCPRCGMRLV